MEADKQVCVGMGMALLSEIKGRIASWSQQFRQEASKALLR